MTYQTTVFAVLAIAYFVVRYFNSTDVPKIKGIPEIPGWPIFGSLIELGDKHAKVAGTWAQKYGPVFQARLGNKRIIFANTFDSVRELWIKNQSALISRPTLHTFHTVVSSSQGFTIGTSPWDESCKARRKAAATALNKPSVASYMPIIDLESTFSIKEIFANSKDGTVEVDPCAYFQRFALNTSLTLNYGFRIEGNINDTLLNEITTVERLVSNFRSTSNNWADYIPVMRPFTNLGSGPTDARKRRDVYMNKLLGMLKQKIADGTDKPCITGNILKDPEAKLNDAEINSIGLTMVSAGLDTVPGNLIMALAYLGSPEGQEMQERGYKEIMEAYPGGDAWEKCTTEEKVPFITAFVKETLRFWTVIPICLPRVSVKDIEWQGATIPAGTTFYMNAYSADYDAEHYKEPFQFNPDRFLGEKSEEVAGTAHYGYGAGSRMCAGSHLANRELYTCFLRIILAFNITECAEQEDRPVLDALECNNIPTSLTMDPKQFKLNFKCRGGDDGKRKLERWIEESEERTKDLRDVYDCATVECLK